MVNFDGVRDCVERERRKVAEEANERVVKHCDGRGEGRVRRAVVLRASNGACW